MKSEKLVRKLPTMVVTPIFAASAIISAVMASEICGIWARASARVHSVTGARASRRAALRIPASSPGISAAPPRSSVPMAAKPARSPAPQMTSPAETISMATPASAGHTPRRR